MNRFVVVFVAVIVLVVSSSAEARILGRRRGGGNMGGGNGVCNMTTCPISAAGCAGGNCNLKGSAAPAAADPLTVKKTDEDVSGYFVPKAKSATRLTHRQTSKYRFDVAEEAATLASN